MRKVTMAAALLTTGGLMLAGCGEKKEASAPAEAPKTAEAAAPSGPTTTEVDYRCSNGKAVKAVYDNAKSTQAKATLTIDGMTYVTTIAISASGARYTGESAPTAGRRLTWWTKGDTADWYESLLSAGDAQGLQPVASCTKVGAAG
jgi:membrane-bound inhibitor of C-type lysozyme